MVVGSIPTIYPIKNLIFFFKDNKAFKEKEIDKKKLFNHKIYPSEFIYKSCLLLNLNYDNKTNLKNKNIFNPFKIDFKIIQNVKLSFNNFCLFGLNLKNLNFKYFFLLMNLNTLKKKINYSSNQLKKKNEISIEQKSTKKSSKIIKTLFLLFLKIITYEVKNLSLSQKKDFLILYIKKFNLFFFLNLFFFFKTLINNLSFNYLYFSFFKSKSLNYKKIKSIKKRLKKKNYKLN